MGKRGKRKVKTRTKARQLTGRIIIHPEGYGFVVPDQGGAGDIFIPPGKTGTALPGDKVLVQLSPSRRKKRLLEGRVVRVLERKLKELAGFFNGRHLVPRQERILYWFYIPPDKTSGAKPGDLVWAKITSYPTSRGQAQAEIIEIIGKEITPYLESKVILRQYGFSEEFSPLVERELKKIPDKVNPRDFPGRKDLSQIPLVTIDPVDARDFDDAICVKKLPDGFRLWVAIADLSEYVKPETELDNEAYQRSFSVYLPDRAVPMLPEPISGGIASLKPGEYRLAMVVEMDFDQKGKRRRTDFYPALIKSWARLNYQEVETIFSGDKELARKYEPVVEMLGQARALAKILSQRRIRRGAIDLDIPEPKVELNEEGEPADIYPHTRLFSHRLVEEFMLQANQSVAEFLTKKGLSFPYRIHEPPAPDKIQELDIFLSALGYPLLKPGRDPAQIQPRDFQNLLRRIKNRPISGLVSYLVLRAQMQAKYSPKNQGHFGLALNCYCHFTSPIRRYPDLMVHRVLKQALGILPTGQEIAPQPLKTACEHCSEQERTSEEAEREVIRVYQVRLMSKYLGEQFRAVVSGIGEPGIFVQLEKPMVEGLIPARELAGYDYQPELYTAFIKEPKLEIHLGDQVLVAVESVNLEHREINFRLLGLLESALEISLAGIRKARQQKKKPSGRTQRKKSRRKPGKRRT